MVEAEVVSRDEMGKVEPAQDGFGGTLEFVVDEEEEGGGEVVDGGVEMEKVLADSEGREAPRGLESASR